MPCILFVDDEPRILDGLRQSLRTQRKVWDMRFAASGEAAIKELETGSFDVIVSDMRMPKIDGAEVLSRAAKLQPHAARIVLSGHMDEKAAARAAQVAHRFLSKPCEPATLQHTISRTLELRALLTSDTIRSCVGGMGTLPSPPKTCLALNRALEQDAPVTTVAGIIESDVAMTSKVLQLVNSSFFGLPRKLANVNQAVNYLGLNTLRNLVLAQSMFEACGGANLKELEREQARSLMCARIARALLPDKKQADLASTAALLHDVGILALRSRLPRQHREVEREAQARGVPLHHVELERFGTTHAEVGAYLLGLWGLPFDVIEAVAHHHCDLAALSTLDLNSAVCVAVSQTGMLLPEPEGACLHAEPLPEDLPERLGLTLQLAQLTEEVQKAEKPS